LNLGGHCKEQQLRISERLCWSNTRYEWGINTRP